MFLKYICQKFSKKNCGKPVFLEELQAARNCSNVSLHFNKIPNSLRQILQTYPEICIFCVLQKIVLQKQSAKVDLKVPGKSCDEIDVIVNFGQKYEVDLAIYYYVYHFSYDWLIFYKCYHFTVL